MLALASPSLVYASAIPAHTVQEAGAGPSTSLEASILETSDPHTREATDFIYRTQARTLWSVAEHLSPLPLDTPLSSRPYPSILSSSIEYNP